MRSLFEDMLGNSLLLDTPPRRIISLVPSQTELLYTLGLDEQVVGITKFCVHPQKWFRNKERVGGTKTLHLDKIKALRPDLIIANKEENEKEQIEALAKKFPVWVSDIRTLEDALRMIRGVGDVTGKAKEAYSLAEDIDKRFKRLGKKGKGGRVAYFIWYRPWMAAGGDTFINDILSRMGFQNVLKDKNRYPEVNPADLLHAGVEKILLSSEPFPFGEKHIAELQSLLPDVAVQLVDGEMFSWYGSRLLQAADYLDRCV